MKKLNPTIVYSECFWMYWGVYCVFSSFGSVFLLDKGYTNTEIGTLLAIGNIVSVIVQPISANIADRSKKLNAISIMFIMTIIIAFFEAFCLAIDNKSMVLFVAYVMVVALHGAMQSLLNSVESMFLHNGVRADYGIARGMGSLGFSLTSLGLGLVIAAAGVASLPIVTEVYLALSLLGLFVLLKMYNGSRTAKDNAIGFDEVSVAEEKHEITMREFVSRHKVFLFITIGIFLMFYHHQVINYYMLQVFQNVGGDSDDMGTYYAIMTLLEMPALLGFTTLRKKFSSRFLLKVGTIGLVLRGVMMFLAHSPLAVQLSLIVNPIGFPLFLAAIVQYISEIMDEGEAVRGQSLYVMMVTASAVVASFTGGVVLDKLGASKMLLICLVLCIVGAAIVLPLIDKATVECKKED